MNIQLTDRYKAAGIDYPDPRTMCPGPCEGLGIYPHQSLPDVIFVDDMGHSDIIEQQRWEAAHRKRNLKTLFFHAFTCDGWHFIKCPDCDGTGRIYGEPSVWGDWRIKPE